MKKELVKAAKILGNSNDLLTDVMEFYAEVVRVVVSKNRKEKVENDRRVRKLFHASRSPVKADSVVN